MVMMVTKTIYLMIRNINIYIYICIYIYIFLMVNTVCLVVKISIYIYDGNKNNIFDDKNNYVYLMVKKHYI